ncbi:MAG TPA: PilZ domain-containing protein [Syntrophorhabdaceae bacterium]
MTFRPGINTRIVTEIDLMKEIIHVKNSIVYEVNGRTVIMAQTDPPILKSMLNREFIVTYLIHEKGEAVRYGFPAVLVRFLEGYKLNSSQEVTALEVSMRVEPSPYSIRMFYRVEPTGRSNLALSVFHKQVNILDISLGGARFSHDKRFVFEPDRKVELYMTLEGKTYNLDGRILRTWEGENERFKHELGFASVEFLNMTRTLEHALSRKIREIERDNRFNEVFP